MSDFLQSGSSPLARGTRPTYWHQNVPPRLIPARAGNTAVSIGIRNHLPAHPRSRGEHKWTARRTFGITGSSPLARGTRFHSMEDDPGARLIPARAGNTTSENGRLRTSAAHPRSRGEHLGALDLPRRDVGSSPLARGTRGDGRMYALHERLIPARAGNTVIMQGRGCAASAHPRSRGEHSAGVSGWKSAAGSSPLARGTLKCR